MRDTTRSIHPPLDLDDEALFRHLSTSGHWLGTRVDELASRAGGLSPLMQLDAAPLPAYRLDPATAGAHETVARAVIAAIQNPENVTRFADLEAAGLPPARLFDDEAATIAQRLLGRVLEREPSVLGTTKDPRRIAAALVWAAMRGNGLLGRVASRKGCRATSLWWLFAVNDATKLALKLVTAAGCTGLSDRVWDSARQRHLVLGDAQLLHSRYRADLIRQRDDWIETCRRRLEAEDNARPIRDIGGGTVCLRATQLPPLLAIKTLLPAGGLAVVVGFGHDNEEAELFALTIPQARRLVTLVERALSDPCPNLNSPRVEMTAPTGELPEQRRGASPHGG